mmetsp:Transcript_17786/g.38801  ORF Transcript_17786/g.38801 Transcript_17786/m.38801 type:complete len:441 (-) Transcript_17786:476-1798(-)|eukprot:CAMPEP_0118932440 /NCGR_PEP_ID=MMETSP1169-20130426/10241_1 /TAXON_ID=36882 /ORGANISM="Pyramimonas obovata, Strain CCMP722" /LENGTH=440 /DNA_ID=CAMNT_0006875101 /DNA_START=82 /DNA_END=1404 /DNA_ORIENTATION=+
MLALIPQKHASIGQNRVASHRSRRFSTRLKVVAVQGNDGENKSDSRKRLHTKLCIVGSGPAAHTAAIYASRANLQPVLFEGEAMPGGPVPGGQLLTTTTVENFPGFPEPIDGWELMYRMKTQSEHHGTQICTEMIDEVDFSKSPFELWNDSTHVTADSVIIATGSRARRLDFPGSESGPAGLYGRGISACAVCDGGLPHLRNKPLAVIGGGDSALTEAIHLTHFASKVYIINWIDYLLASKKMQDDIAKYGDKIEVLHQTQVVEARGDDHLTEVILEDCCNGKRRSLAVAGLFVSIGYLPATQFLGGQVELDEGGYIVTAPDSTGTSVKGVFAAGDVKDKVFRQAVVAAGSGCMAALEAASYIESLSGEDRAMTPDDMSCVVGDDEDGGDGAAVEPDLTEDESAMADERPMTVMPVVTMVSDDAELPTLAPRPVRKAVSN